VLYPYIQHIHTHTYTNTYTYTHTQGDTSGSLKKFFIKLINSRRDHVPNPEPEIERDIVELYNAGTRVLSYLDSGHTFLWFITGWCRQDNLSAECYIVGQV